MNLVALPVDELLAHPSLPFPLYARDGRVLLQANTSLKNPLVREKLQRLGELFVQPMHHDAWRRGMEKMVSAAVHQNAKLSHLAAARPELVEATIAKTPGEEWEALVMELDRAMQAAAPDKPWLEQMWGVRNRLRQLTAHRRLDEALFYFLNTGGTRLSFYSSRHALRCLLLAGEAARELQWDEERLAVLDRAALSMNVAAWRLQDRLVRHSGRIDNPAERTQIAQHPAEGARLLQDSGVTDAAWLEAVRLHHDDTLAQRPLAELTPGQQIALLLRRVDRYGAMLSRRAGREALSSVQAAQQTCLGPDGRPDPVGSLLLKAVGLYPPGTYVALASRECGVVLQRGDQANRPVVAALINSEGMIMSEPRLRYTVQTTHAVSAALPPGQVHVEPDLEKLQALYTYLRSR
jgi:hypothetical protein